MQFVILNKSLLMLILNTIFLGDIENAQLALLKGNTSSDSNLRA